MRRELDAPAVGADAVVLPPGGLQRVAVAHPDLRLARVLREDARVDLDRALVFAEPTRDRGLEVAIAGIARLLAEQAVDLGQRLGDLLWRCRTSA